MTKLLASIGSQAAGTCTGHDNPIDWTGVLDTTPNTIGSVLGEPLAVVGSSGLATCGHRFVVLDGSAIGTCQGIPLATVGSSCPTTAGGTGAITTGISNATVSS